MNNQGTVSGRVDAAVIEELREALDGGNLVLFVLHDSGLVGLAALIAVVVAAAAMVRRAGAVAGPLRGHAGGALVVAGVALLFAWQFTHALWLMYPYVYLGLLATSLDRPARPGEGTALG